MIKHNVLIVGSNGYLGSALLLYLKNLSFLQVSEFKTENRIPEDSEMMNLISNFDVIIHVAGGGGNKYCIKEPLKAYRDMIQFTESLVRNSISQKIPKIIFTSSMYVYDSNLTLNKISEDSPLNPRDYYSSLKLASEKIIERHPNNFILRLSHLYGFGSGNRLFKGGVVNKICKQAAEKKKIALSHPSLSLDLVCIEDVLKSIEILIINNFGSQVINIGGGALTELKQVIKYIEEILGHKVELEFENYKQKNQVFLNIDRAKDVLNWMPKSDMRLEIKKILNEYY